MKLHARIHPGSKPLRIGEKLKLFGIINASQEDAVLKKMQTEHLRFGDAVVELGFANRNEIERMASLHIRSIDIDKISIKDDVASLIPRDIARKHTMVVFAADEKVAHVAIADPSDLDAIDEASRISGRKILSYYANRDAIIRVLGRVYDPNRTSIKIQDDDDAANILDSIIEDAAYANATDIHIMPSENNVHIKMRVSGIMSDMTSLPKELHDKLVARIKIRANMDIAEKRRPQDGRFTFSSQNMEFDVRISTVGANHGESVVLRLLPKNQDMISFKKLGMPEQVSKEIEDICSLPHGIFLVSGPTGSGKSTTLYSMLYHVDRKTRSVFTIEDPIEYEMDDIVQIPVRYSIGSGWSEIFRSVLRQDPDVVMIGEIRDGETAEIALRASITGHMVMSSVHANDTISTIRRLMDMGVDRYLLPMAIRGVLAQRLVRTLCNYCKEELSPEVVERIVEKYDLDRSRHWVFYHSKGCDMCRHRGFTGRIGIFEMMTGNEQVIQRIASGEKINHELILTNGRTMFMDGIEKAAQGLTTIDEIVRVTEIA